jgi:hypothetical protein
MGKKTKQRRRESAEQPRPGPARTVCEHSCSVKSALSLPLATPTTDTPKARFYAWRSGLESTPVGIS